MIAIGTDIIEVDRIKSSMENPRFLTRFFGEEEYEFLKSKKFNPESVAANFCAKEAFFKSIGTGIQNWGLKNVQLLRNELGRPYFKFSGKILDLVVQNDYSFSVSVSHTKNYATATVICYSKNKEL